MDGVHQRRGDFRLFDGNQPVPGHGKDLADADIAHIHAGVAGPAQVAVGGLRHLAADFQRFGSTVGIGRCNGDLRWLQPHIRQVFADFLHISGHLIGGGDQCDGFQHFSADAFADGGISIQQKGAVLILEGIVLAVQLLHAEGEQRGSVRLRKVFLPVGGRVRHGAGNGLLLPLWQQQEDSCCRRQQSGQQGRQEPGVFFTGGFFGRMLHRGGFLSFWKKGVGIDAPIAVREQGLQPYGAHPTSEGEPKAFRQTTSGARGSAGRTD